jgi:hypothetical protein
LKTASTKHIYGQKAKDEKDIIAGTKKERESDLDISGPNMSVTAVMAVTRLIELYYYQHLAAQRRGTGSIFSSVYQYCIVRLKCKIEHNKRFYCHESSSPSGTLPPRHHMSTRLHRRPKRFALLDMTLGAQLPP